MNTVKSIAIIAALERHIARNGAKRPTDRRPTACPGRGTSRTRRHPSRRTQTTSHWAKSQSAVGSSSGRHHGRNSYGNAAPQEHVHVGKGQ